jgi:PKD repeat protein
VDEEVVVTLDGSFSLDIDDGIASFLWTQIGVPEITLSNPTSSQPTFTAPSVRPDGASLAFNLTVTDAGGLQNTDSCIVNISWQNEPPTAVVTPDYMETTEGSLVILDGSASTDSDDGIASYLWSQVEGDPVSLSDPTSTVTTFTAPKTDPNGKNLKFKLTVKDHGGLKGTADSSIYVRQNELSNNSPIADFSYAKIRKRVTFTDQSTDSDGIIVSWFWDFGDGKTSSNKNPSHWYRGYGTYTITLTVTDDDGAKNSQLKTVTFETKTRKWWRQWEWR